MMNLDQSAKLKHDLRSAIRTMEQAVKILGEDTVDPELKAALVGSLELAIKNLEANYKRLAEP
ncbi:MAG: hypothetical protein AB7T49_01830 [Oligoflexales bacterium]